MVLMCGFATPSGWLSLFHTYNSFFACILHFSEFPLSIIVPLCELVNHKISLTTLPIVWKQSIVELVLQRNFHSNPFPFFGVSQWNAIITLICPYTFCNSFISPKISGIGPLNRLLDRYLQLSMESDC
jgi:hypothetical protein